MENQAVKRPTTSIGEATTKGHATVLDSIRFLKSFQAIPFVKIDGSVRSRQNSKKHSKTPWQIVQNGCSIFSVTAKNSDEDWRPEIFPKMQSSRILRGFFCACNMRLRSHSAMIMVDSAGESKDSPLIFGSGNAKPASVCLPLIGVEGGSLKKPKGDCTMSIKSHTGNPHSKKHSKTPWQIVQNGCNIFSVTAKNSDQDWSPEVFPKMHSRILRGFFCACNMRLRSYSAIISMADGVEESKDSPLIFGSGKTNSALVCLPLIGLKEGSLKKPKGDCTMSIKSHSGNPPDKPDKIPLSWRSLATISVRFPIALTHKFALSALFRRFISVNVPVSASFVNA